jgi:hypothetical protein
VEELRDERTFAMRGPEYGCRYAHSIISERLLARLDMQLQNVERDKQYKKLWRIDGPVQVLTWKRLLSAYDRDNPLVGEYLGGKKALYVGDPDDSEGEGDEAAAELPALLSLTGPRVMISFRPPPPDDAKRKVIPLQALGFADGPVSVVESPTVELVERLRQAGHLLLLATGAFRAGGEPGPVLRQGAWIQGQSSPSGHRLRYLSDTPPPGSPYLYRGACGRPAS